jgi:hypothetical protein
MERDEIEESMDRAKEDQCAMEKKVEGEGATIGGDEGARGEVTVVPSLCPCRPLHELMRSTMVGSYGACRSAQNSSLYRSPSCRSARLCLLAHWVDTRVRLERENR